jgi:superkiller protein 8
VWDVERRVCVATHSESEKGIWGVMWLPRGETQVERGRSERFVSVGGGAVGVYREASGG